MLTVNISGLNKLLFLLAIYCFLMASVVGCNTPTGQTKNSTLPKDQIEHHQTNSHLKSRSDKSLEILENTETSIDIPRTSEAVESYSGTDLSVIPPKLQNLLIQDLGPFNSDENTYGAIAFKDDLPMLIFDDFGRKDTHNPSNASLNTSFKFRAPLTTLLNSPISGSVTYKEWQSNKNFPSGDVSGDWEIHISNEPFSQWVIIIDHIVSLDCERSSKLARACKLELSTDGQAIEVGTKITAGQPIGYIGDWLYDNDGPTYGHTELTVMQYSKDRSSATVYCPIPYLDTNKRDEYASAIANLMKSYERWAKDESIYIENQTPYSGCLYEEIIINSDGATIAN